MQGVGGGGALALLHSKAEYNACRRDGEKAN